MGCNGCYVRGSEPQREVLISDLEEFIDSGKDPSELTRYSVIKIKHTPGKGMRSTSEAHALADYFLESDAFRNYHFKRVREGREIYFIATREKTQ